jgi:hypothetical protein
MEAAQVPVRIRRRRCTPKHYPCPECGVRGARKGFHTRRVRDLAYGEILWLEVVTAEYRAKCSCCKSFRSQIPGIEPRAEYTNRVREAVIDRMFDDSMSAQRIQQAMRRDFHLCLSDHFLSDCLDWKVRQADAPAYRQWTLQNFSGVLCVDEIHLGHRTVLLATDPEGDFPVGFALVSTNDSDHLKRFLQNLKQHGFLPRIVVTDGSPLYPATLAQVWPQAQQQLCIFHVLQDVNKKVFDALRKLRKRLTAKIPKGRRGRPYKSQRRARLRHKTARENAKFIWEHRYLIATKLENYSREDWDHLLEMYRILPELKTLRNFVLDIYQLFDVYQTPGWAKRRRNALAQNADFQADPDLAEAIELIRPERFDKMIVFLKIPRQKPVRTNNHVERTNRKLRFFEKVRYKWRRRRTIVRFLVIALNRWKRDGLSAPSQEFPMKMTA